MTYRRKTQILILAYLSHSIDDIVFQGERGEMQEIHAGIDNVAPEEKMISQSIAVRLFDLMPEKS